MPSADIERAYNNNIDQYSTPEQVRASHILLKTEGKDDAAVKAKAEDILKQAKSGADFAELAKKHSEDEASAKNGGDLDYFGKGKMVPEFDQAVFAMQPGQISDQPVKTQYGYHIMEVLSRGLAKPGQCAQPGAPAGSGQSLTPEQSQAFLAPYYKGRQPGWGLQTLDYWTNFPKFIASTGLLKTVVAKQDSYVPKIEEVKERVRDVVVKQKARDLSKQKAAEIAAKLKSASDFVNAAKAAGVEAKTTELIARDSPIPDVGNAPAVEDTAFSLPVGGVSDPIQTDSGTAVIKVLEKQEVTPDEWKNNRDHFREELLADRRNRFFTAYMAKAKQKMKIEVNREALQRAVS